MWSRSSGRSPLHDQPPPETPGNNTAFRRFKPRAPGKTPLMPVRRVDRHPLRRLVEFDPLRCSQPGARALSVPFPGVRRAFADTLGDVMAAAFATEATHIQKIGHLSAADIARATGANETTVRAWLRGSRSPSGARAERLAELSAIVERLARVMQPTYVPVWMRKPVPLLDDDKPLDVIAAGDYRRVSRVVAGLESPGAI